MLIVIAGAGSVGRSIARELLSRGHQVTLCDSNPEAMKVSAVAEANWILGDVAAPDVMERAGAKEADVVVAATGDDCTNLVISLLAKTQFGVPRVIARVNNPKNEWMFDESWGVDVPVSTPRMMTGLVEEAVSIGELVRLFHFHTANTTLYSVVLPEASPVLQRLLTEIAWPGGVLLCAVMTDGQALDPSTVIKLKAGNQLLFLLPADRPAAKSALNETLTAAVLQPLDRKRTASEKLTPVPAQQQPTQIGEKRE